MGRGFWFQWTPVGRSEKTINYAACSMTCQDIIAAMATKGMGRLVDKTNMEAKAIKAARQPFYNALVAIGVASAFDNCTAEQIDSVIEAVWDGLQESMQHQSEQDEIPF